MPTIPKLLPCNVPFMKGIAVTLIIAFLALLTMTQRAAAESAGFFGAWSNTDPNSNAFARILIQEEAGQVHMDCWDRAGQDSKELTARPRISIPLSRSEVSDKKTISFESESSFSVTKYTLRLQGNKVSLRQKITYTEPGRTPIEDDSVFKREEEESTEVPTDEGILGKWRNKHGSVLVYEKGGKIYLSTWGPPRELPLSPAEAAAGTGTPVTIETKKGANPETITITLRDNILTLDTKTAYPSGPRVVTEKYQPANRK